MAGASLIALAFIVDWIGISEPGFGPSQALAYIGGVWVLVVGWCISNELFLTDFCGAVRSRPLDVGFGFALFCAALIVGTLYVSTAKSGGIEAFYRATLPDPPNLPYIYNGFVFGVVTALSFCIFRLGMGRVLSVLCSLLFMLSSLHLYNLVPSLYRVYAKVPIILAMVFLMGLLVAFPVKKFWLYRLSIAGGLILGTGLWVREELPIFILPFTALILFFLPGPVVSNLKIRFVALALFAASLIFSSAPYLGKILAGSTRASASTLNTVAGLMVPLDALLGVSRPAYDWGYLSNDYMTHSVPHAHAKAIAQVNHAFPSEGYDPGGIKYLKAIAVNFPADILTRIYASILKVLDLAFVYTEPPLGTNRDFIVGLYSWRASLLDSLAGSGLFLAVAALLLISISSLRQAVFCLFLLIFLGGYPVLQFYGMHYFYLEFISWWILGFVAQCCVDAILFLTKGLRRGAEIPSCTRFAREEALTGRPIRRLAVVLVVLPLITLVPLMSLRQYQSRHIGDLLRDYGNADMQAVPLMQRWIANGRVLITSPEVIQQAPYGEISGQFLVAEFGSPDCSYSTVWPVFRYRPSLSEVRREVLGAGDFSRTMRVDLQGSTQEATRVSFLAMSVNAAPAVGSFSSHFMGIEMSREQAPCLRGLYRIKDPSRFPILVTAVFPSNGQPLYQRLTEWERGNVYTIPANMPPQMADGLVGRLKTPLTPGDVVSRANIVNLGAQEWRVKGYATPPTGAYDYPMLDRTQSVVAALSFADVSSAQVDTDLLMTKEMPLTKGSYFIAQGRLNTGGVTFALVKNKQTAGYVHITKRGPFTVVIEVQEDGPYIVGLANDLNGYTSLENRFVVTRIGWVEAQRTTEN